MFQLSARKLVSAAIVALVLSLTGTAFAQYTLTTFVKNSGKHGDKQLINPWGLAYGPSEYFWFSDQGTGLSTLYDGNGVKQSLVVTIPPSFGHGPWLADRHRLQRRLAIPDHALDFGVHVRDPRRPDLRLVAFRTE